MQFPALFSIIFIRNCDSISTYRHSLSLSDGWARRQKLEKRGKKLSEEMLGEEEQPQKVSALSHLPLRIMAAIIVTGWLEAPLVLLLLPRHVPISHVLSGMSG